MTLFDVAQPCAGATGAGQGYIWMAHRNPQSPAWLYALRSSLLWKEWLDETTPLNKVAVEWQNSGSMLLATSAVETAELLTRQGLLKSAGMPSHVLSSSEACTLERHLTLPHCGAALVVPTDAQINGRAAVATLLSVCESYGSQFQCTFQEGASDLIVNDQAVTGLVTDSGRVVKTKLGIIVALGAWTGPFLARCLSDNVFLDIIKPRRGHLLEIYDSGVSLRYGLMEMGYTKHYSSENDATSLDITFTATQSIHGSILIGSSRELDEWDSQPSEEVIKSILIRSNEFIPAISNNTKIHKVRVGPRPYSSRKRPYAGKVKEGLFIAAGHEGSGLTLGPATGELLSNLVLGNEPALDPAAVEYLSY